METISIVVLAVLSAITIGTLGPRRTIHEGLTNELREVLCDSKGGLCGDGDKNEIKVGKLINITQRIGTNRAFPWIMAVVAFLDLVLVLTRWLAIQSSTLYDEVCLPLVDFGFNAGTLLLLAFGILNVVDVARNPHSTTSW